MITKFYVGNYYGCLKVKEDDGKYFWTIEDWDGDYWLEIPEQLYKALLPYGYSD